MNTNDLVANPILQDDRDAFVPIPPPPPVKLRTPQQIMYGPPLDPLHHVKDYSEDEFECLIQEWAYYYQQKIKKHYTQVGRFGGAGDKGRDVVGYIDCPSSSGRLDIYQCKHYGRGLYPSDAWLELGKLCHYTFKKVFVIPETYRFVCPYNVGSELGLLLENPEKLRSELMAHWEGTVSKK